MARTTDNNQGKELSKIFKTDDISLIHSDLIHIANQKIGDMINKNENLLVFPLSIDSYNDDLSSAAIFNLSNDKLFTHNIMGFVGCNNSELTISSRFYKGGNDYFLHYMLQKVFSINIFDLKHSSASENLWDFLLYLFPTLLKKALAQGLYKEYQKREYNNTNVRGTIDMNRHIKTNIPFNGKIAYRTREHSYENDITHLIRHTIEHIRVHKFGANILNNDPDTQKAVSQIIHATPSYDRNQRGSIIYKNYRPNNHPYFTEYRLLQKICLQILRYEGLTFGKEKDKVYGLLFDGAWLWEEYLNTILKSENFIHPRNKGKAEEKKPIYLFQDQQYKRFPDFYCRKNEIVLDAKYKHLEYANELSREDIHQIISYMYVLKSKHGGFIFPIEKTDTDKWDDSKLIGTLNGFGGNINLFGLSIASDASSFVDFCSSMKKVETVLLQNVSAIVKMHIAVSAVY
jgi:5-methylcytosine-specific restriction endonuclease McrBC regulatory subunit McrC